MTTGYSNAPGTVFDWDNWNWDNGQVWGPLGATPTLPLGVIIPAYPYLQYSDDQNICAFFFAYNTLAQQYLDWFNTTALSVYPLATINGPLLDWIMLGIYGIKRPVFSSLTTRYIAGINSQPINAAAINAPTILQSGTATIATDDYFKRVGTWVQYLGNGRRFNVPWLRWRVARFIYGANGSDCTIEQMQSIHILAGFLPLPSPPALSYVPGGTIAATTYASVITYVTPNGETLSSLPSVLAVPANNLLVVDSPPNAPGAIGWNAYVGTVTNMPSQFRAGINANPINSDPINGSNVPPITFEKQNLLPLAIGTNWVEPTTGLILGGLPPTENTSNSDANLIIVVPASQQSSQYFQQAFEQGILPFPFQLTGTVVIE